MIARTVALLLIGALCASGFSTSRSCSRSLARLQMASSGLSKPAAAAVIAIMASGMLSSAAPAFAANYGGFGSTYSEVIAPKDAVIDQELAGTDSFKKGQEGLAKVLLLVQALKSDVLANNQMDVYSRVKSDFKIAEIRNSLNNYSAAFSEDTQRGSDRLIRQVIQNFTELLREGQVKEGKDRSSAKTQAVLRRLSATESALDQLTQYYNK